jgi:hypothetical protein
LPTNFSSREEIEADYKRRRAGYRGEQSLEYHLSFLAEEEYFIFHDLRLPLNNSFFQIDTLLVTPHYALIIEAKNIAGTLLFDTTFNQLIRTFQDKEEGFKDPISQVKRQTFQLEKWLEQNQFILPIESLIVISNPSSIIKSDTQAAARQIQKQVIHVEFLLSHLQKLTSQKPTHDKRSLKKLHRLLLKQHSPPSFDIEATYQISPSTILKGVQCSHCYQIPMRRETAKWHCPFCKMTSKDAHIQAIQDYFLLISPTISSGDAAEFLRISSIDLAYRLLSSMNFSHSGKTKGRVYHTPF